MQQSFEKRIGSNGDSLVLTITKEARQIGYDKGDVIPVTIGEPSPEEQYVKSFADFLYVKNADFININCLNPADLRGGSTELTDFASNIPENTRLMIQCALDVMQDVIRAAVDTTKENTNSEYAYYSDIKKSFVKKFFDVTPKDPELYNYCQLYCLMQTVLKLLTKYNAYANSMDRIADLHKNIAQCVEDLSAVCSAGDVKISRDEAVSGANAKYESDKEVALGHKKVCIVAAFEWIPETEHRYVPSGEYEFYTVDTEDKGIADKTVSEMDPVYEGGFWETKAFGPFEEDFANEIASYLRIQSKIEGVNPESILDWAKGYVNRLTRG